MKRQENIPWSEMTAAEKAEWQAWNAAADPFKNAPSKPTSKTLQWIGLATVAFVVLGGAWQERSEIELALAQVVIGVPTLIVVALLLKKLKL